MDRNKQFWCLDGYESETSVIVDGKFAPTNGWLCGKLNELNDECEFLEIENEALEDAASRYAELCHKSLKENGQLKKENKELKKQMNRLYNYFRDWHSDEMGGNQFSEMWDMVKESEEWEKR